MKTVILKMLLQADGNRNFIPTPSTTIFGTESKVVACTMNPLTHCTYYDVYLVLFNGYANNDMASYLSHCRVFDGNQKVLSVEEFIDEYNEYQGDKSAFANGLLEYLDVEVVDDKIRKI